MLFHAAEKRREEKRVNLESQMKFYLEKLFVSAVYTGVLFPRHYCAPSSTSKFYINLTNVISLDNADIPQCLNKRCPLRQAAKSNTNAFTGVLASKHEVFICTSYDTCFFIQTPPPINISPYPYSYVWEMSRKLLNLGEERS